MTRKEDYPMFLEATHIAEILGVSRRFAYEIMDRPDFPLIKVKSSKRVDKERFFEWVNSQTVNNKKEA